MFIALLAIIESKVVKRQHWLLVILATTVIVLFQGLRWRTGTDWDNYYNFFIASDDWNKCINYGFEIGYSALNYIVRSITDSYSVFLLLECIINSIFIWLSAKSLFKENIIAIILVVFACGIFPIRQTLAISIIMYSYKFIIERKFFKYVLVLLLAFSIHRTTLVFFPVYFISNWHLSGKMVFSLFFASVLLGFATEMIFGNVLDVALSAYDLFGDTVQGKLNQYVSEDIPEYAKMSPSRIFLSVINSIAFLGIFYLFKRKRLYNNEIYNVLFNLHLFGICINRLMWLPIPDFARVTSYFVMCDVFLFLFIIGSTRKENRKFWLIVLLGYYLIKYISTINGQYSDLYIPYYSVFSDTERIVGY